MKEGRKEEAEEVKREVTAMKARLNELLDKAETNNKELDDTIVLLPNIPCDLVIPGKGAEDNQIVKEGGPEVHLPQDALPHWELARKYDLIDFDLGVKLTGAGFPVYKGKGAKLQRALINYFLDFNTAAGYKEVEPDSFPTRKPRCTMSALMTSISSLRPRCLSPIYSGMSFSRTRRSPRR